MGETEGEVRVVVEVGRVPVVVEVGIELAMCLNTEVEMEARVKVELQQLVLVATVERMTTLSLLGYESISASFERKTVVDHPESRQPPGDNLQEIASY